MLCHTAAHLVAQEPQLLLEALILLPQPLVVLIRLTVAPRQRIRLLGRLLLNVSKLIDLPHKQAGQAEQSDIATAQNILWSSSKSALDRLVNSSRQQYLLLQHVQVLLLAPS